MLIITNVAIDKWEDDRPTFYFGKDYCSVNYYKDGLLWKLKDDNGNDKIPFKLSFDREVYIGDAALEHPEFLMLEIDLETLLNDKAFHKISEKRDDFIQNDKQKYKILLRTFNGFRKTSRENIIAIFIKSILNLLESKLEKFLKEIYLEFKFSHNLCVANALKFLTVSFEKKVA